MELNTSFAIIWETVAAYGLLTWINVARPRGLNT